MIVPAVLDAAGRRRSPATIPVTTRDVRHATRGSSYPADPPTIEQIVAVMREANDDRHGWGLRALMSATAGLRQHRAPRE